MVLISTSANNFVALVTKQITPLVSITRTVDKFATHGYGTIKNTPKLGGFGKLLRWMNHFFREPLSITEEEDWGLPGKRMTNGFLD